MKLTPGNSMIIVLLSFSTLYAQGPTRLKGKVVRENPSERSEIKITVRDRDTGKPVEGEQLSTRIDDWYHVVRPTTLVDVEFDGGPCYLGDGHSRIRVQQIDEVLPDVKLQKTRECRIAESIRDKPARKKTWSTITRTQVYTPQAGGRASAGIGVTTTATVSARGSEESTSETILLPSPEVLKQELEAEAAHARNGEFFDTFQYKFALKLELYGDRPALVKVLTDFRSKKENAVFFQTIGQVTPEMFTDVVRREFQLSEEVNLNNVFAVLKEDAVSQNTRGSANVALLNGDLPDQMKKEVREYHRQQSPSSPIFLTSLVALQRIGEYDDQERLYDYVTDADGETRNIAMEAVYLSALIEGPQALPGASKSLAKVANSDADPSVRAIAFHSLRPFLNYNDKTAVKALLKNLKDPNETVRLQVVWALGVAQTEKNPKVKDRLQKISQGDRSAEVRKAALFTLSGFSTTMIATTALIVDISN